jgi:predicted Zn-dependent peptidase
MSEVTKLGNGVRIVTDPMPGLESAAIGVWFRAGAIDETPEEHGIAHLLEHMAFKGTAKRSARAIAEEIENVGGYLNASTGYGRTGYYARILRPDIETAFDILADILINPLLADDELTKEKEVVIQEIGEAADVPDDAVMEMLQAICYRGHALGRPILGTVESVNSHTSRRLRDFMQKHYAPQDTVVVASGAIDPDIVARLAEKYFGGVAKSDRKVRDIKPAYHGGAHHDPRDIEQTHAAMCFPGVSVQHEDFFATRVFVEALGGGMSSRIFQTVREARGLAYSVYSFTDAYDDVGAIGAYVGTDADNAPESIALIRQEIAGMAQGATKAETDRARALLKSTLLMGLESPAARAEAATSQLFTHGRLLSTEEIREKLDAVTVADVRKCAERALTGGEPALSVVGPANFDAMKESICGRPA